MDDDFDVLIVGAGISGIGAAWHLQQRCPGKRFAILEAQDGYGGTWRTHRYPGIRSDSDLFTFGYRFKPWMGQPIATAEQIQQYLGEVIADHDLAPHLRYGHAVTAANWSSAEQRWTLTATHQGQTLQFKARFLFMCQGYYRHAAGYLPQWPGMASFAGRIVHPQTWPDDLDLRRKKVVVIGSGATAATLIPAIAGQCAHVTMLQRSPTFFISGRNANELADMLRELDIPPAWTHEIVRRKVLLEQAKFTQRCLVEPEVVRHELLAGVRAALGPGHEALVDAHFNPRYRPWQQRIAFVPDGDLFRCVREGQASVLTDQIEGFEPQGIRLQSGALLEANVVVSATGFELSVFGDIAFAIDGRPLDFAQTVGWHGAMFSGVPNLAWVFGYFRASWTLRADLLAEFVCRLLQHMDARGSGMVTPELRQQDQAMALKPWVEGDNFNPGYLQRGMQRLPRQGSHAPWRHSQDYEADKVELPLADLDDGTLQYR